MQVYNEHLYGVRLSKEEIEKDRINKQSLSNMIDMVLCNALENDEDFTDDLCYTVDEDDRERICSMTDEELKNEYINTYDDVDECEINTYEDRCEIEDALIDNERGYSRQFYQYFIVCEDGRDIIKKFFPSETVVYFQKLDIYVWCIEHWGMSWSMFYSENKISEV